MQSFLDEIAIYQRQIDALLPKIKESEEEAEFGDFQTQIKEAEDSLKDAVSNLENWVEETLPFTEQDGARAKLHRFFDERQLKRKIRAACVQGQRNVRAQGPRRRERLLGLNEDKKKKNEQMSELQRNQRKTDNLQRSITNMLQAHEMADTGAETLRMSAAVRDKIERKSKEMSREIKTSKSILKNLFARYWGDKMIYTIAFSIYFLVAFYIVQKRLRANIPGFSYLEHMLLMPLRWLFGYFVSKDEPHVPLMESEEVITMNEPDPIEPPTHEEL